MTTNTTVFKDPASFHEQLQAIQPVVESNPEKEIHNNTPEETQQDNVLEPQEESIHSQDIDEEQTGGEEPTDKSKKENKYVPRSRLNEISEKKAALEVQVQKEREDRIRLETQLQMFMHQRQNEQARNFVPEMDLDNIDPLDLDTHNIYKREIKSLREEVSKVRENTEKHAEMMYLSNTANAQEAKFREKHNDYEGALKHLADIEIFDAELEYGNKEQARQLAAQKLIRIAQNAIKTGGNSAETLYNMAVKKGFKGAANAKDYDATKKGPNLEAINKNMQKSASIGNLGTGAKMSPTSHSYDLSKLRKDPKNPNSKLDADKFHRALQEIR